jgi:predicted membrane chloride channel (bestrophin family)
VEAGLQDLRAKGKCVNKNQYLTPFPLLCRPTARFLFTWLTLLPFALYGTCGVWTTPVVAGVAAVLCGIEEIGVQVEEPLG